MLRSVRVSVHVLSGVLLNTLLCLFSLYGAWAAEVEDMVTISIPDTFVSPGVTEIEIPILLKNENVPVRGVQIGLAYDPDLLEIVDFQKADRTSRMNLVAHNVPSPGELRALILDLEAERIEPGSGAIAILLINVLDSARGSVTTLTFITEGWPTTMVIGELGHSLPLSVEHSTIAIYALLARIPSVPAVPGETIQVPVLVDDLTGKGVVSSDILVSYDSSVLTALDVATQGSLLEGIPSANIQHNITLGQIDIALTSAPDTLSGEGALVYLLFQVSNSVEPGFFSGVQLTEMILNDGLPLVATEHGRVGITKLGDVSYNFRITAYDAALTILANVGEIVLPDPEYPNLRLVVGDVDEDGDMDAVDASLMLQYAVGLISSFPGSMAKVVTTVGLGDVERMGDGTLVVPIVVEELRDVLAGELELSVSGRGAPVRIVQGEGIDKYVFASRVEGNTVRIAFAGVRSEDGSGRVAELHFDSEEGEIGEVELLSVKLNEDRVGIGQNLVKVLDKPEVYRLSQNYPNPFNPGTAIEYEIVEGGDVELGIYNTRGQKVRGLVDAYRERGRYQVEWDGRDEEGIEVSAGVYLYHLRANRFSCIKKMTLVR